MVKLSDTERTLVEIAIYSASNEIASRIFKMNLDSDAKLKLMDKLQFDIPEFIEKTIKEIEGVM